jgi:hypothetical protein
MQDNDSRLVGWRQVDVYILTEKLFLAYVKLISSQLSRGIPFGWALFYYSFINNLVVGVIILKSWVRRRNAQEEQYNNMHLPSSWDVICPWSICWGSSRFPGSPLQPISSSIGTEYTSGAASDTSGFTVLPNPEFWIVRMPLVFGT